ncbi:hypothetical protein BA011_33345 (plasmid) [Rhizobium leguminosarum]|uniref:Uncharacterized protein n=1 Tax=Rhizobium leguminosarum TaxID=384 RepID=A0A1B1CM15_RHILE|nr:hypothetical protein BA011_33345 [Rhizobium leguminosarum]
MEDPDARRWLLCALLSVVQATHSISQKRTLLCYWEAAWITDLKSILERKPKIEFQVAPAL